MKTKLYIEKLFKLATAVVGFSVVALASSLATADERSLTEQLEAAEAARVADEAGIHGTRQWAGFEMHKEGFHDAIDSAQWLRARAQGGLKMTREDLHNAREAYREMLKSNPARLISSGTAAWLETAEARYAAAKEVADLYRDIAKRQLQDGVDRLTTAAQNLRYANKVYNRETGRWERETEHSFFEALGEHGSLTKGSSDDKGARGVNGRALGLKLSETLWKSSEAASEHAAAIFIRDKIDVFKNENRGEFKFAKEDYFDDFKDRQEKGVQDKVAQDILDRNREDKIERIAMATERREERRVEKAAKNEEKAEVKAEKRAEKEEAKQEKDDKKDDKKKDDTKDNNDDGGKKEKRNK